MQVPEVIALPECCISDAAAMQPIYTHQNRSEQYNITLIQLNPTPNPPNPLASARIYQKGRLS
jgi:hypothetical protein